MEYRKRINDYGPIETEYNTGYERKKVTLSIGEYYEVVYANPRNKKNRGNNGRIVEVLGFTDDLCGDVIVRYKDNNRRGRVNVNCLLPVNKLQSDLDKHCKEGPE
jgi:hypothetical protein